MATKCRVVLIVIVLTGAAGDGSVRAGANEDRFKAASPTRPTRSCRARA